MAHVEAAGWRAYREAAGEEARRWAHLLEGLALTGDAPQRLDVASDLQRDVGVVDLSGLQRAEPPRPASASAGMHCAVAHELAALHVEAFALGGLAGGRDPAVSERGHCDPVKTQEGWVTLAAPSGAAGYVK
jgi:hypothetical protein